MELYLVLTIFERIKMLDDQKYLHMHKKRLTDAETITQILIHQVHALWDNISLAEPVIRVLARPGMHDTQLAVRVNGYATMGMSEMVLFV
jgi:hypothetical protein